MSFSTLSVPRIIDVADAVHRNLTADNAKNFLLVYFFAGRAWKLFRHIRARGLFRSLKDVYVFIAQVRTFCYSSFQLNSRFALENPSACHIMAVFAQESGDGTR